MGEAIRAVCLQWPQSAKASAKEDKYMDEMGKLGARFHRPTKWACALGTGPAARMRRYRQRRANGVVVIPVEVSPLVVNYLIRIGRLNEYERRDRAKIGRLVSNSLRRYVERANARAS